MSRIDLLVVGPESTSSGGVAQYVNEQPARLPEEVDPRVFDLATDSGGGLVEYARATLSSLVDLCRFPLRRRPDVVHVHASHRFSFYRAAAYVLFVAHVWRRPVVVHVHGSSFDAFVRTDSRIVRALQSAVFDASDVVVALSEYWRDVLGDRADREKLVVVPNAVDAAEYEPSFEVHPPRIAFVSNHIERKGILELVEAVDRLAGGDAPAFEVVIAGDGPLSGEAAALAERHDFVDYRGYVSEREKRQLLDRSTIYALPTHGEGLPIGLLEGMAAGNAVVSTPTASIPEVVDADNGLLVEPGDADALADALRELLDRPERAAEMGRANRDLVVERYDWSVTTDRLVDVYRDLARD